MQATSVASEPDALWKNIDGTPRGFKCAGAELAAHPGAQLDRAHSGEYVKGLTRSSGRDDPSQRSTRQLRVNERAKSGGRSDSGG